MSHTPGPWMASEGYPSDVWHVDMPGRGYAISVSRSDSDTDMTVEEVQANARLIAAAPSLLESIDQVCAALETCMAHYGDRMCEADRRSRYAALAAARTAQANAEGFASWEEAMAAWTEE